MLAHPCTTGQCFPRHLRWSWYRTSSGIWGFLPTAAARAPTQTRSDWKSRGDAGTPERWAHEQVLFPPGWPFLTSNQDTRRWQSPPVPPLRLGDSDTPSDKFSLRSRVTPRMLSPNRSFSLIYTLPPSCHTCARLTRRLAAQPHKYQPRWPASLISDKCQFSQDSYIPVQKYQNTLFRKQKVSFFVKRSSRP